jgi:peptidoglycan/xylan/chitin deacetylase (PgdA/CDA1 family)
MRRRLRARLSARRADQLRLVVAVVQAARLALSSRPVAVVLLYHRLERVAGDPSRELVPAVSADTFGLQLRWLSRLFRIVPAADVLEEASRRRRGRRLPVAITFDDEWPTHVELALPALRAHAACATFFLTGAHLDGRNPFWWEALQHAFDHEIAVDDLAGVGDVFALAAEITQADATRRAVTSVALRRRAGPDVRSGSTPNEIKAMAVADEVGFHTVRHDTLTGLSDTELEAAMRDGRDALEGVTGRPLRLIAYPHGGAGDREARAAQRAGFARGFTAEHEACGPWTDPFLIPRVEPGEVPLGSFLRIITGVLA